MICSFYFELPASCITYNALARNYKVTFSFLKNEHYKNFRTLHGTYRTLGATPLKELVSAKLGIP
jgi:hypothetical protein